MATLSDLIALILEMAAHAGQESPAEGGFEADLARQIEAQVRGRYPGERIYVAPSGRRNDPERAARIADLARRLPTGVVAERAGVSRQYVHRVLARRK